MMKMIFGSFIGCAAAIGIIAYAALTLRTDRDGNWHVF